MGRRAGRARRAGDVERVADLATACARPGRRDGRRGARRAVAAISHLPLVVAAALVEAVARPTPGDARRLAAAAALAAGGWRDTTRVARGDPAMGAAIVATNAPALAARLRDLRAVLDGWLAELERPGGPDEARWPDRLAAARASLEEPA